VIPASVLAIFALFHLLAARLGSTRGEAGLVVGAVVVAATIGVQAVLFRQRPVTAARWLGLGRPRARGVGAAVVVSLALVAVLPIYAVASGMTVEWYPGWLWLVPGLFAQGGVAEETLFRGYLFHHFREGRSFWRAVLVSLWPFVVAHLVLFLSMPWPVAVAAVALSVAVSPPLAWLFELGGRTIWAPAILHFVIQSALKVMTFPEDEGAQLPIIWMAACAAVPYLVFFLRRPGGRQ
jgi:membrane protease YdiL (CAAX protease family)